MNGFMEEEMSTEDEVKFLKAEIANCQDRKEKKKLEKKLNKIMKRINCHNRINKIIKRRGK